MEKGLISKPMKKVFASNYIGDTLCSYVVMRRHSKEMDSGLIAWSHGVLSKYFTVVTSTASPAVNDAREQFRCCLDQMGQPDPTSLSLRDRLLRSSEPASERSSPTEGTALRVPFKRSGNPLRIDIDGLHELAIRRRSVRWYLAKPISRKIIDRAVQIAAESPSACNRQPYFFRVFDNPELAQRLGSIPMGTKGFSHQFPVFIVIVGKLGAYPFSRDRHAIYVDASLAAMALQLSLEAQGVSSCSINWPDIPSKNREMAEALRLADDERIVMCMSAGYSDPEALIPFSQKKPVDELRSYNQL
ncbi:MAG: nitroreductase family protein [Planctomycetota bacterium]